MDVGGQGDHRSRFEFSGASRPGHDAAGPTKPEPELKSGRFTGDDLLGQAIGRTRDYLLSQQHEQGYWVAELEGDTILESEYILLLAFLGKTDTETARLAGNYLRKHQTPGGGWAAYPGGPLEISGSVKAYFALKLVGHSPDAEYMIRARDAILAAGGAEKVNSFTRFYLALLDIISYEQVPAVPPELILLPSWSPINIYEMSAWSRTIVIPLSILWAHRPCHPIAEEHRIDELFVNSPQELPASMGSSETLDDMQSDTWLDWDKFFRRVDAGFKFLERNRIKPLRKRALKKATAWMEERFAGSDGLGAIFPPIVWSLIALKCLGHDDDSPDVVRAMNELDKLMIRDEDSIRLQPCKSPVWDTALTTIALRDAGVSADHPAIRRSAQWLLSKEVRQAGDWQTLNSHLQPAGWFFEFNNQFYPDVDDTIMVIMALRKTLPPEHEAEFYAAYSAFDGEMAAVISGNKSLKSAAVSQVESVRPVLEAINRGTRWVLGMQNSDGGWGAFDVDNNREILTRVPFADHNAMIDPSWPDITARVVEMLAQIGFSKEHPQIIRALEYVFEHQETDHCWFGRWGVNYIYGTWQTVVGLREIGVPAHDPRIEGAVDWLKSTQQSCGGWGETPQSYDDPSLRGQGEVTPSQTAWALLGLLSAGEENSVAVQRGIDYLIDTQLPDGTWDESQFTGTGFPRVFYLRYHYYRLYFPLMALGRAAALRAGK
ncbi:Squalene--hopene cyclase [Symmachiella dynata]|uniref:terpene cyclase/mutase family protein n=1 Tax=Symmachiella dynata TaxID=2527995 RepID=UPI00118904D4|nr:terpene cyclase/mutase family protein [Symmachiella dynata]QDT47883.1 Squalene--hopene cyclase [Symmachiella dynata]